MEAVVIAGGGQAGYQTAASLRTEGYAGSIFLIGEEPHLPYQRPPLSKAFVLGKQDQARLLLRPESFYGGHQIEVLSGEMVVAIERTMQQIRLKSGRRLTYSKLVLALGASNRRIPVPGGDLDGVCYLRTLNEAVELKQRLEQAARVVVIGGGFAGLEVAASARALGKEVAVIEALPRLMARAVGSVISEFIHAAHVAPGVEILLSAQVEEIRGSEGKAREVVLKDGRSIAADLVVVAVGIAPRTDLAREAGLPVENGIVVDELLRTADERIFAIGDCAQYPSSFSGTTRASGIGAECGGSRRQRGADHCRQTSRLSRGAVVLVGSVRDPAADGRIAGRPRSPGGARPSGERKIFGISFSSRENCVRSIRSIVRRITWRRGVCCIHVRR